MHIRTILRTLPAAVLLLLDPSAAAAQALDLKEWPVEWAGRPRDPDVDANGHVWFVGQAGNYIGRFDPATEQFTRFEIEEGTLPHNLIVGSDGHIWYAGNGNARIGRLNPADGKARTYPMPNAAARDPHTLIEDGRGHIWFTVQGGGHIGRLDMESGNVQLLKAAGENTRPYGIRIDSRGDAWVNLFGTNRIAHVDAASFEARDVVTPREAARTRRIEVTPDDVVWYVDFAGGRLGRLDPGSATFEEWVTPGGERSQPYAMTRDAENRIWLSECARGATFLTMFDPATKQFTHRTPVSSCIRHMVYHAPTRTIWFGTDANNIGRLVVPEDS